MKQYEEVFFSVLRTALWKKPLEIPEGFSDWMSVLRIANSQALMGLVSDVFLKRPDIQSALTPKALAKVKSTPLTNIATHTALNNALILVVTTLRKHGIEPVLLKGQGLAQYYPVPQLRQCGDIDLYVGKDNYEKTYDVIQPIVSEIEPKDKIWNWMHFDAKLGMVQLEVHQQADYVQTEKLKEVYGNYSLAGLSGQLPTVELAGGDVSLPADNFNAFYIFYHLWRHFSTSGVGLRQFCDLMCFLHAKRDTLDLTYLEKILNDMGLMTPWKVFGGVIVDVLGLPQDEYPFYDKKYTSKKTQVLEYILKDGNFGVHTGYSRVRKNSYLVEKMISLRCHLSRTSRMFYIFPSLTVKRFFQMLRAGFQQVREDMHE